MKLTRHLPATWPKVCCEPFCRRTIFASLADLLNEIEFGDHKNRTVVNPQAIPQLPQQPTPGYQVYLGTSPNSEQPLAQTRLSLRNAHGFWSKHAGDYNRS